jgi:putative flavoprotein involved in K+ transport
MTNHYDVLVIGAGQAGLAAGYHLQRANLKFAILEASSQPTGSWPAYYDSLKLFSPARYSSLPGLAFPGNPEHYPTRDEVVAYLRQYASHFHLPIIVQACVHNISRAPGDVFQVQTVDGRLFTANYLVAATGAFNKPYFPTLPGQEGFKGQILHTASYRHPEPFIGKRVIVVGAGNSAVQVAVELAQHTQVTLTSREPVRFRSQRIWGKDVHFWLTLSRLDTIPTRIYDLSKGASGVLDTGIYQEAMRARKPAYRPMFTGFTEDGVIWSDGTNEPVDAVIFATGYRPNLDFLAALNEIQPNGYPKQREGISTHTPGLYYVGLSMQRSHASATIRGVGNDAAHVVKHIKQALGLKNSDSHTPLLKMRRKLIR